MARCPKKRKIALGYAETKVLSHFCKVDNPFRRAFCTWVWRPSLASFHGDSKDTLCPDTHFLRSKLQQRPYDIICTMPRQVFSDGNQTIGDAGLKNASVVQHLI